MKTKSEVEKKAESVENETNVPVLLSEQSEPIAQINQIATADVYTLNQLHRKKSIGGVREYREVISNAESLVFQETLKRSPKAKELHDAGFDLKKMSFTKPMEVQELENLLQSAKKDNILKYAKFDKELDKWVINEQFVNSEIKRLQVWAESPEELKRFHAAKALCDFIENELQAGDNGKQRLANEMVTFKKGRLVPSEFFVKKGDYKF